MGYTSDRLPHIGPIPKRPNQYILAGFNRHGMPVAVSAGKAIAQMIEAGNNYEETWDNWPLWLPRLYKTTEERLQSEKNEISLSSLQ